MAYGEVKLVNGKRVATPEYRSWQMMKNRCLNPLAQDWHRYGGKGITVDPRWFFFDNFLEDMGRRPTPKHTIERKDGTVGYCKENCEWATRETQSRNRACVKLSVDLANDIRAMYAGGGQTQHQIAIKYGVTQAMISAIVRNANWSTGSEVEHG